MATTIAVSTRVARPIAQVWTCFTDPKHIMHWNAASNDWHCPKAENDLRVGGMFNYRMEARDGSFGFDFAGIYTEVKPQQRFAYTIGDGRKVSVDFVQDGKITRVTETFEAETQNPIEVQRQGWQAILDRFKAYAERA